jgi:hypothetical protein
MLIAAFIFVASLAVVIQFGLLSWHAGLIRVAAESAQCGPASASAKPLISEGFQSPARTLTVAPIWGCRQCASITGPLNLSGT